MTDRLIRITRALAVAAVAALISYQHAYELTPSHREFELLMTLIRTGHRARTDGIEAEPRYQAAPALAHDASAELPVAPSLEQTVLGRHQAGQSQRAIARELNLDRRRMKRIIDQAA